jgi:hypothetical protein
MGPGGGPKPERKAKEENQRKPLSVVLQAVKR